MLPFSSAPSVRAAHAVQARCAARASQRGGTLIGFVLGLLLGLALALGVALYVTKVPIPFINKVPQRTADQDAAELEKNKNWDPNTPLRGKAPAASGSVAPPTAAAPGGKVVPPDMSGVLGGSDAPATPGPALPGAGNATTQAADPFVYFVQAGAYSRSEEAEAQRAKLAIQGFESKITEREQSGRTVYRVRVGPFNQRTEAEAAKASLDGSGLESALVRVQK